MREEKKRKGKHNQELGDNKVNNNTSNRQHSTAIANE